MRRLTLARLRVHATLIAATLWSIWAFDMAVPGPLDRLGKVKATDFLHFYVIGSLAHEGRWQDLYDVRAQYALATAVAPGSDETLFVPIESPQVAVLYAPLSGHSYTVAVLLWLVGSGLVYVACCLAVWRLCDRLHPHRYLIAAACAAFPGLFSLVLHGQTSVLSLACIVLAILALRQQHDFIAGLALGCLIFKPHWLVAAAAVFLLAGAWRVLTGAFVSAITQVVFIGLYVGGPVMQAYWAALEAIPRIENLLEPKPGDSVKGLLTLLVPSQSVALTLYAAASIGIGIIAARVWRSGSPFNVRMSAMLIALVLVSPHVNAYDLVVFAPVYLLLADWLMDQSSPGDFSMPHLRVLQVCLCLSFIAPLLGGAPALIRLPCSVLSIATVLLLLARRSGTFQPGVAI